MFGFKITTKRAAVLSAILIFVIGFGGLVAHCEQSNAEIVVGLIGIAI